MGSLKVWLLSVLAVAVAVALAAGAILYLHNPARGLPYRDAFVINRADEWRAFGGTWDMSQGVMRNASDERGAKLLTGSKYWHNYSVEADVMLLGQDGDAGLIIRSSNEEDGVDAYTGYYAGLRNHDNSLVLGRAQHKWREETKKLDLVNSGIRPFQWYHLKLLAYGCQLIASAGLSGETSVTIVSIQDRLCIQSGHIGLRSYSSGGAWKNVIARPATNADATAMLAEASNPANVVRAPSPGKEQGHGMQPAPRYDEILSAPRKQIGDLRLASYSNVTRATVRGAVILTSPTLFLQDSSGGIEVPHADAPPLKIGDEVEATGEVHPADFDSTLEHATVRVLWAHTPTPAVSVTAEQAATGAFDANFVEIEGQLLSKSQGTGNTLVLELESGPEAFRAIMDRSRGGQLFKQLKPGSLLRLRGICVVDPAYTQYLTPFVLLLRSPDDLTVTAGPPWWNKAHLIALAAGVLIVAIGISFLYSRAERWKLHAVFQERERLAQEMHDTLAQSFAGIGFQIEAIRNEMPDELSNIHQQLDLATHLVRHSHVEARRSIAALRPETLESGDLIAALAYCAEHLVEKGKVRIDTSCIGDVRPLPIRVIDALYRIGQEALANAVCHAQADTITVSLEYQPYGICLIVSDNGVGFTQLDVERGFGLSGIRKRAAGLSAKCNITSQPGKGTRIEVHVPLSGAETPLSRMRLLWNQLKGGRIRCRRSKAQVSAS